MIDSPVPRRTLLVVAKQPIPGQAKTRLCPPLTGQQAAALYEAFLRDTLEIIRVARQEIAFDPIIAYLPEGAEGYFYALAPDFAFLAQQGRDLSERLNHATTHYLTEGGYNQVVIMDSDSPTLPATRLVEAFNALDRADVSLGPCDDGGYYLIGLKRPAPPLFLGITMSTDHVVADTLAQAKNERLTVTMLSTCFDIDYVADLKRLVVELNTASNDVALHTRAFLQANPAIWV